LEIGQWIAFASNALLDCGNMVGTGGAGERAAEKGTARPVQEILDISSTRLRSRNVPISTWDFRGV
jgi:hypothetical protein